ncbi:Ig-like domain-containing protein [Halobacterium wangiae]|uniref:Ig-like domain-containing protein n=1 Tax=Halobacterium wangiae TaxID=2902623 RepID=UPI001E5FAD9F|nr:Ig-like domain-containing protein [Halobacterium wangiae]
MCVGEELRLEFVGAVAERLEEGLQVVRGVEARPVGRDLAGDGGAQRRESERALVLLGQLFVLQGADRPAATTPFVVQPGANQTLTVTFAPAAPGPHVATVELAHNDSDASPSVVGLAGNAVDTTAPAVTIDTVEGSAVNGTTVYANDTVVVDGTAGDQYGTVDSVVVDLESTSVRYVHSTTANYDSGTGEWSADVDLSTLVDDGTYRVTVRARDDSGNENATTATESLVVDREPPGLATVLSRVNATFARVNVTADEPLQDDTLDVTVDRPDGSSVTVPLARADGRWNGTFELVGTPGQYEARATALDEAGNRGTADATAVFETASTDENNTITVKVEPSNLFVRFTTNQSVNDTFVTMTASNRPLAPLVRGNAGVNFIDAILGPELTANLSYATIGIPVDEAGLPGGSTVDDVTIRYFNETAHQWEDVPTTVETVTLRDGTTGEYWVANVSHFSTYGAVAVDTTAPTVTSLTPTPGHEFPAGTTSTTLEIDYADALSGVDTSAVSLTYDGVDVTDDSATSVTSTGVTYTPTGLANGSSYTLAVTVEDYAGNSHTETLSFDVADPAVSQPPSNPGTSDPSPPTSSPPATPTPPVDPPETERPAPAVDVSPRLDGGFDATVTDARANERVTFAVPAGAVASDGVSLDALDVTAAVDGDLAFQVTGSRDRPTGSRAFDEAAGVPLVFLNVSHPTVSDDQIANATFHLTVSRDRLADGTSPSDLVLYRDHGGAWTALETRVVESTTDAVVLEVASPGLSVFALAARQPTTTAQPTTVDSTTTTTAPTTTPSNQETGVDSGSSGTTVTVFLGLLAVLSLLAVAFHRRRS